MDASGAGGGKVFGRFTEPAHRVLDLARGEADLEVDPGRLQEAVAAELRGSQR
jgi:hypothetical protein